MKKILVCIIRRIHWPLISFSAFLPAETSLHREATIPYHTTRVLAKKTISQLLLKHTTDANKDAHVFYIFVFWSWKYKIDSKKNCTFSWMSNNTEWTNKSSPKSKLSWSRQATWSSSCKIKQFKNKNTPLVFIPFYHWNMKHKRFHLYWFD